MVKRFNQLRGEGERGRGCLCYPNEFLLTPFTNTPPGSSFFFLSSRRRHTRFDCDWSSDVCSSDLIHDLERDKVLRDVAEHRGELSSGIVDRVEAGTVYVDLNRIEGVMPPEEQIPGEELHPGKPVLVVILETQHNPRQAQVRVSRASRSFVHRLLEAEVPEIKAGTVQIRGIAREPGLRTKIAVSASEPGIDPVGACVGPKGVRHRAILSELASEHVDIVPWSDDPEVFVAASLGPAKAESVHIDKATRTATVLVPRGQLSLAIGRDGQNARLAARLTGFRIDIKPSDSDEASP